MEPIPTEAKNLPLHVAKCELRYQSLEQRLSRLERTLYWCTAVLLTGMATIIFKLFLLVQEIN
jgi:hypothetical protein